MPAKKTAKKTAKSKTAKSVKKVKPSAAKPAKKSTKKAAKKKTVAPKKSTVAPKKKAVAPKKKIVAPEKKAVAAKKSTVAPKQKTATVKSVVAPAKNQAAPKKDTSESYALAASVVNGMLEKKAENIVCLDLRQLENAVTDFYIICEGNSNIQVEAIADSVEEIVKKEKGQRPYRSEGWENALWVLIDYVDVIVHVFDRETRYFYNLESLWADAEEVKFSTR